MAWTVGEAARVAKVSVRTLHHYDEIGLLTPSARSDAGYRLYDSADVERLYQVLLFRELGFSLEDIRHIMTDPEFDRAKALRAQRTLLAEKARRTEAMLSAIDAALAALEEGTPMDKEEMFEVFDGFDPSEYEDEVKERWGETDAYRQSAERTKHYTRADWEQMKAEAAENAAAFVALMDAGVPPESPEAMALAENHRLHIQKWFYDIPLEMYGNLSHIWVDDPRFTKNIDKARPGLAAYQFAAAQALVKSRT